MKPSIDEMIAAIAAVQHSVLARRQVPEIDSRALLRRTRSGILVADSANVLRVAAAPQTDLQRVMAGTLDVPGGAVASHLTAAWLWEIPGFPLRQVEVTARRQQHRQPELAWVHHPRLVLPGEVTVRRGIPVTSLAMTIYTIAGRIPRRRLLWVVDRVGNQSQATLQRLHDLLPVLAASGRNGITDMRWVLRKNPPGVRPPGSGTEREFEEMTAAAGITGLRRQVDLGGHSWLGRVDYLCELTGVIFELDSELNHTSPEDVANDKRRDEAMKAAGATDVVRIWTELVWRDPPEVLRIVRATRREHRRAA